MALGTFDADTDGQFCANGLVVDTGVPELGGLRYYSYCDMNISIVNYASSADRFEANGQFGECTSPMLARNLNGVFVGAHNNYYIGTHPVGLVTQCRVTPNQSPVDTLQGVSPNSA